MLLPLIALAAIGGAQGSHVRAEDAARMRAAELLLTGDTKRLLLDARSTDAVAKRSAIWALGQTGDTKWLPIILDAAFDSETSYVAKGALHSIGLPAYEALQNRAMRGMIESRRSAAALLLSLATGSHGPKPNRAGPLLWGLRESDDPQIRYYALLGQDNAETRLSNEVFADFLDDPYPEIRRLVVRYLSETRIDPSLALRLLKMSMNDQDMEVRAFILERFFWMGGLTLNSREREEFEAVRHALSDEPRVALAALQIVARVAGPIGRRTAATIVRQDPETADKMRRVQAVWYSDDLREKVYRLTSAPDREVRRDAVLGLAALRDPRAVDMIAAWQPKDSWERMRMLEALGWTDDLDAIPHLLKAATMPAIGANARAAVDKSLATLGASEHSDIYISQILDKSVSANDRSDIARAVTVPDAKFVEAVFSVVEDTADDKQVRGNLLSILPGLDAKRAFDTAVWVLERTEDGPIHWQAVAVLERIGDPRAIPYIERALVGADATLKRVGERALEALRRKDHDQGNLHINGADRSFR